MNHQVTNRARNGFQIFSFLIVFCLFAATIQPARAIAASPTSWQVEVNNSHWDTQFSPRGLNGWVGDLEFGADGTLYASGRIYEAGTASIYGLARWVNNQWQAFGKFRTTMSSDIYSGDGFVNQVAVFGQNIYVGGNFSYIKSFYQAKNVAWWNGSEWLRMGSGIEEEVTALTVDQNGYVFAGTISGDIYRWNGSTWTLEGSANDEITALAIDSDGTLYASGYFSTIGEVTVNYIAMKSGGVWQSMAGGASCIDEDDPYVFDIALWNEKLYAGGWFDKVGGVSSPYLAYWQAGEWHAVGGPDSGVQALKPAGSLLWVGGSMESVNGFSSGNIAAWNGNSWQVLPEQINNQSISAIAVSGTQLVVGGRIYSAGGTGVMSVARWTGSSWVSLGNGQGASDAIQSMLMSPDQMTLYVGGKFDSIGGAVAHHIAQWDGSQWHAMGDGFDRGQSGPEVKALLLQGETVYAAGRFTSSGVVPLNNIAQWNGAAWLPLGDGLTYANGEDGIIAALASDGSGQLFAGGMFLESGSQVLNNVAVWNGDSWSPLGSGLNGQVFALAYDETSGLLYAAGGLIDYPWSGFVSVWNGSAWQMLGHEADNSIYALMLAPDGKIYIGGAFQSIGGVSMGPVAYWQESSWHPVSEFSKNSYVQALAMDSHGGIIAAAMNNPFSGIPELDGAIFRWDSYRWRNLGGDVWRHNSDYYYGDAYNIAIHNGSVVFVGGDFDRAGTIPSANIAAFTLGSAPIMADITKSIPQGTSTYFFWDVVKQSFQDVDAGDQLEHLVITSLPEHGVLSFDDVPITSIPADGYEVEMDEYYGYLSYSPEQDYVGTDSFSWVASDGTLTAEPSMVNLVVHSTNELPQVNDVTYTMQPGGWGKNIHITDFIPGFSDLDGDELQSIKIVSLPEQGTLTFHGNPVQIGDEFVISDYYLDYENVISYNTGDSFQWTGSDGLDYAPVPASYIIRTSIMNIYLPFIQR